MHGDGLSARALFLVQKNEFPSLIHSKVFAVNYDFGLILARSINQIQTFVFAVCKDENSFSKPRQFEESPTVQFEHLCFVPFGIVNGLYDSVDMKKAPSVVLDSHVAVLVINFKFLIFPLFSDL